MMRPIPIAYSATGRSNRPVGDWRVRHTEFLADYKQTTGETGFTTRSLSLNPGFFPWLGGLASAFEQYRFHSLKIFYVPSCPTTVDGEVYIMLDYDTEDAYPTTDAEVLNNEDSCYGPLYRYIETKVDVKAGQSGVTTMRKKVRNSSVTGDMQDYDYATLYYGFLSTTYTPSCGRLMVTYDVEFFKPQTSNAATTAATEVSEFKFLPDVPLNSGSTLDLEIAPFIDDLDNGLHWTRDATIDPDRVLSCKTKGVYKITYIINIQVDPTGAGPATLPAQSWIRTDGVNDLATECTVSLLSDPVRIQATTLTYSKLVHYEAGTTMSVRLSNASITDMTILGGTIHISCA